MYKKVNASLNFLDREKEVIDFWNQNQVFEKSIAKNEIIVQGNLVGFVEEDGDGKKD